MQMKMICKTKNKSTGDVFCAGLDLYDFKENNITNALSDALIFFKPKLLY